MTKLILAISFITAISTISGCGGGKKDAETKNTPTVQSQFKPTTTEVNATFSGTSATGAPVPDTPVFAYNAKGVQCAKGKTGSDGKFTITGKCVFPVLLAADTPDFQGRSLFAIVPTISTDGEVVPVNITPMTTALAYIVNNGMPSLGGVLSSTVITKDRLNSAQLKLRSILQPIFNNLAIDTSPDFQSGQIVVGKDQDILMDQVTIFFESIPSTGANVLRLTFPSENRPITIVQDSKDPESLRVDSGLGILPKDVDVNRMASAKNVVAELSELINGKSVSDLSGLFDTCYLHNGSTDKQDFSMIFDATMPWGSGMPTATNFRLIRYNTKIDFNNTSEENLNTGGGELVYISFDYKTPRGALSRTHTWMVRGTQNMSDGCVSSGNTWKLAGNQRASYIRTSAYAVHKIDYNGSFSGRKDSYGSGVELFVEDPNTKFVYAQLSGPGLPSNGVVFLKTDGAFLVADTTPLAIRKAAINFKPSVKCDMNCYINTPKIALSEIFDTVDDTRSVLMNDTEIKSIKDSFFGNVYTVRLFKKYDDLFPSMTIEDLLPKRPQLSSEMKPVNYPSLGVNLDTLVVGLQQLSSIAINWSLPTDARGLPLESLEVGFQRKNCQNETRNWPLCSKRSTQTNELFFTGTYIDKGETSIHLTPNRPVPSGTKTFESRLRVRVIDTLNRPLEVSVGMNYAL